MITHKPYCTGQRELHIVYQKAEDRYRIIHRCPCGALRRLGRYLYRGYAAAETAMNTTPVEKLFTQKKPKLATVLPVVEAPAIPLNQAWIICWRGICARNGYVSRL